MGRDRESAEILEFKGKSHISKADLEERKRSRFVLGDSNLVEPLHVADDPVAHEKWIWLIDLYNSSRQFKNHITTANTDQIATYCILYSNQLSIIENLKNSKGQSRAALSNALLKTSTELNKLGKDLLLDFFSMAKVQAPPEEKPKDPLQAAGFGNV